MSNLQVPDGKLAQIRVHEPQAWDYVQEQIRTVLADPPGMLRELIDKLGLEGAHEALEASLDAGTMKFIREGQDGEWFGLAFYCDNLDQYFIMGEDGRLRLPQDTYFETPEDEDDQ